jgi:hypothetical protein
MKSKMTTEDIKCKDSAEEEDSGGKPAQVTAVIEPTKEMVNDCEEIIQDTFAGIE